MNSVQSFDIGLDHLKALDDDIFEDGTAQVENNSEEDGQLKYVVAKKPFFTVSGEELNFTTVREESESEDESDEEDDCPSNSALEVIKEKKDDSNAVFSLYGGKYNGDFSFFLQINPTFAERMKKYFLEPVIDTEINAVSVCNRKVWVNSPPKLEKPYIARKSTGGYYGRWVVRKRLDCKYKSKRVEKNEATKIIPIQLDSKELRSRLEEAFMAENPKFIKASWKITISSERMESSFWKLQNKNENSVLKKMYAMDETKDFAFVVANGAEVRAHGTVLMAQSEPFQEMFSPQTKRVERVELAENTEDGLDLFVKFLYGFDIIYTEVRITFSLSLELLKLSHKFGVMDLEEFMIRFLSEKPAEYYSVDGLLELFFFAMNKLERFEGLLKYLKTLLSSLSEAAIQSCEYYKEKMDKDEVLSLLFILNRN